MKGSKRLLMVVFALAIVTCLSAGTLAIYSTTIDDQAVTNVAAKSFVLVSDGSAMQGVDIKLAPDDRMENGQGQDVTFTVSNFEGDTVAEVPIVISFDVQLKGDIFQVARGVEAKIVDAEDPYAYRYGTGVGRPSWLKGYQLNTNGTLKITEYNHASIVLPAGEKTTHTFFLRFQWLDSAGDDWRDTRAGQESYDGTVMLSVIGTQYVEPVSDTI